MLRIGNDTRLHLTPDERERKSTEIHQEVSRVLETEERGLRKYF